MLSRKLTLPQHIFSFTKHGEPATQAYSPVVVSLGLLLGGPGFVPWTWFLWVYPPITTKKKKNHGELVIYCFFEEVFYTPFQFAPVAKCAYLIPVIHETNQLIIYHFNLDAEFVEFAGIISFI